MTHGETITVQPWQRLTQEQIKVIKQQVLTSDFSAFKASEMALFHRRSPAVHALFMKNYTRMLSIGEADMANRFMAGALLAHRVWREGEEGKPAPLLPKTDPEMGVAVDAFMARIPGPAPTEQVSGIQADAYVDRLQELMDGDNVLIETAEGLKSAHSRAGAAQMFLILVDAQLNN